MSNKSKREYLRAIAARYVSAAAEEKTLILDEFCAVCGYNRKYAIRLLNAPVTPPRAGIRAGRPPRYHTRQIRSVLQQLAIASNMVCSKRLKAMIPLWLPHVPTALAPDTIALLLQISPATIDRVLAPWRHHHGKIGLATTKPGSLLRKHIPVKTEQWDESRPGFLEADTVAHCGTSMAGSFVYTVNLVDIATGWSAFAAVWGKGQVAVHRALQGIEKALPFAIRGFDCDNGSEFLNHHLFDYFSKRKRPVDYTRSRPYRKNDNAHIEQKNWSNIRQYFGYLRFDDPRILPLLNDLYSNEFSLLVNFFLPSFKLLHKHRDGPHIIKHHDPPKTPFERLCLTSALSKRRTRELQRLRDSLNPFVLHQQIQRKVLTILTLASPS